MNRRARLQRHQALIDAATTPAAMVTAATAYFTEALAQAPADVAALVATDLARHLVRQVERLECATPKAPPQRRQSAPLIPPRSHA